MTSVAEPIDATQLTTTVAGKSPRQLFWDRFRKDKAALTSLTFIIILILLAVFAGVIARRLVGHGPNVLYGNEMLDDFGLPKGPNAGFWLGADQAGRYGFVRILYGARTSLLVALLATPVSLLIFLLL